MRGLYKVKQELISAIREKELQLSKLKEHIDKDKDYYNLGERGGAEGGGGGSEVACLIYYM